MIMLQMLAFSYSVPLSLSVVLMSGAAMWVILFVLLLLFCLAAYGRFLYKLMRRYIYHNDINVDMKAPRLVPLKWRIRWKIILAAQILNSKAVALRYGNPSAKLRLVGVTGTNGKTTIATVLFNMFRKMGHHCGLISTVCIRIDDEELPPIITTPCAHELNSLMSRMLKAGCEYVFMECSSLNISYSVRLAFLALKNILQIAFSCRKQGELPWERHSVGRLSDFLKVQGTPKPSPVARRPELAPTKSFRQLMSLTL